MPYCPNCEEWVESDDEEIEASAAAIGLLKKYKTGHPSAGDVMKLKELIEGLLVEHFGVSKGTL